MPSRSSAALSAAVQHPLFGLGLTLLAYQGALTVSQRTHLVILQPVLVSAALIVAVLLLPMLMGWLAG